MDGVTSRYSPTAWSQHATVESLQGSYVWLGWDGPGLYRQKLADATAEALHEVYVRKNRTPSLLDVACFTGNYYAKLREMAAFPFVYNGVDVTPEYVAEAKAQHKGATFTVGSALDLPKDWSKTADVVLCAGLLIHVEDPACVIAECVRVAKDWLVLGVSLNTSLQNLDFQDYDPAGQFINRRYRPGYIDGLLSEHGEILCEPTQVYPAGDGAEGVFVVRLRP